MSALAVTSAPAGQNAEDRDLVAAVRGGDDRAFEALYLRYQARITAYVRGMVHDHGRAEDITQEVFISALRRMRASEAAIAFKPWIYEIAKNACIDAWRRSRNTNEVSIDAQDALGGDEHGRLADPGMTPDCAVDNKDALDNLCGAFGGLSPTHHEILVMREFEGLSYREIGERLGMSRPGVESTLFRARRRLTEEYEELVSGERCLRVQRIVDSPGGRAAGVRDQRRMARHLAHCQPCRRYAHLAGVDLGIPARPAAAAASKIAAWLPLPLFLRRRWGGEQLAGSGHHGPLSQWSASFAGTLDPAIVSGWSKAAATAATVAVAGLGAGAAIHEHRAIEKLVGVAPPAAHAAPNGAAGKTGLPGATGAAPAAQPPGARSGDPASGARAGAPAKAAAPAKTSSGGAGAGPTVPAGGSSAPAPSGATAAQRPAAAGADAVAPLLDRPIGAPPSGTTTAGAPQPTIGETVGVLAPAAGTGAGTGAATTGAAQDVSQPPAANVPTAPASPSTGDVTGVGNIVGTLGTPAAKPAPPAKPAAVAAKPTAVAAKPATPAAGVVAAATAVAATASGAVTSALAGTPAGRIAS